MSINITVEQKVALAKETARLKELVTNLKTKSRSYTCLDVFLRH